MLEMQNLAGIVNKIKEVTGVNAFYNDKSESVDTCKFDLRFKGIDWLSPMKQGIIRFDLVLCSGGIGEQFVLNMINTEIQISSAFQVVETSERMLHFINQKEKIELLWNNDLAQIEEETTDTGKRYYYKRFFSLNYYFINS